MYKCMDKNYFEKTLKKETAKKSEWKEIENKMNYKSLQFLIDTATQQDEGGRERGRPNIKCQICVLQKSQMMGQMM